MVNKNKVLTSDELIALIKEATKVEGNEIQIGEFFVHSTSESLKEVEDTINRLIEKHKERINIKDIDYIG